MAPPPEVQTGPGTHGRTRGTTSVFLSLVSAVKTRLDVTTGRNSRGPDRRHATEKVWPRSAGQGAPVSSVARWDRATGARCLPPTRSRAVASGRTCPESDHGCGEQDHRFGKRQLLRIPCVPRLSSLRQTCRPCPDKSDQPDAESIRRAPKPAMTRRHPCAFGPPFVGAWRHTIRRTVFPRQILLLRPN